MEQCILVVFGTRPEIIKLAPLILAIGNSPLKDKVVTLCTSQHEELMDEQLSYWQITPDYFLTPCPDKGNLSRLLSHTLSGMQDVIEKIGSISHVVVQGDTNTALACANLAFLNKIRLIHIEAGLRSFHLESPFPEEYNRSIASKVAYFHFAPTDSARINLLNEGVDKSKIMVTGNTVVDALYHARKKNAVKSIYPDQVIITLHRRDNIEKNYKVLIECIHELAFQNPEIRFLWISHPNCFESIEKHLAVCSNIEIRKHCSYPEFVQLYDTAKLVITDSGGVTEESVHIGLPVIVFRSVTERAEALEVAFPMLISLEKKEILEFFRKNINISTRKNYSYGDGSASKRILNWLIKETTIQIFDTVIIGGGPAGTGLLMKAIKDQGADLQFSKPVALIEKSAHLVSGNITNYHVNSDTLSDVFLECLEGRADEIFDLNELEEAVTNLKKHKGLPIPLPELENYFSILGKQLKRKLEEEGKCEILLNAEVERIIQHKDHSYEIYIKNQKPLRSKKVVIATGGIPKSGHNNLLDFAHEVDLAEFSHKCIHSDELLRGASADRLFQNLKDNPRVLILGGSHSAFSVAHYLLNSGCGDLFKENSVSIWCRKTPKVFFSTREEAIINNYNDFSDEDVCPVTNRLYRLAGLRMDGRQLYMKMTGLGDLPFENRVTLSVYNGNKKKLKDEIKNATYIILAYGYAFNIFPVYDKDGNRMKFAGELDGHWVNKDCALLNEEGAVVPHLYATGLATGFLPAGELGGEPSFAGQTNGIWYYQNAIADKILKCIESEYSAVMS